MSKRSIDMDLDHFDVGGGEQSFAIWDIHDAARIYEPVETVPAVSTQSLGETPVTGPSADQADDTGSSGFALYESSVDDHLVETLAETADPIVATIDADLSQPLQDDIREWLELHGRDPESEDAQRLVAQHAVVTLLLKVTVYEWYHQNEDLPPLPADTRTALRDAGDRTDSPVFDECVLDAVLWETYESAPDAVIEERNRLLASTQPAEDIGWLYEQLTESESRQALGQFRTPPKIAIVVDMLGRDGNGGDTVLDIGIGAGALSTPFHPERTVEPDPDHVIGIDKSPLATLEATTALTLAGQPHSVSVIDFLTSDPEEIQYDYDRLHANLPFTSANSLSREYKQQINEELEETTGLTIGAKSPLYAYCMYQSRRFLSPGDRAVVITPHSFFATKYGETLKQFLLNEFDIKAFVQFDPSADSFFEHADTTALIAVLEATAGDDPSSTTRFVQVDGRVSPRTIYSAALHGEAGSRVWGTINCVDQSDLSPEYNWEALFAPVDVDTSRLTPLREFGTVSRGQTTGEIDLFCLSEDEVARENIDSEYLTRLIRKPELVEGYDLQQQDWEELRAAGEPVWLLDPDEIAAVPASIEAFRKQVADETVTLQENADCDKERNLLEYLQTKVKEYNLDETNTTLRNRQVWYRPTRQNPARVIIVFVDREELKFVLNETDARHINNFYGFDDITVSETELKALLAYLNSGFVDRIIHSYTRTFQSGYEKLKVSDVEALPVIDPTDLPDVVVTDLADAFDDLRATVRSGGNCAPVLDDIDTLLEQAL